MIGQQVFSNTGKGEGSGVDPAIIERARNVIGEFFNNAKGDEA